MRTSRSIAVCICLLVGLNGVAISAAQPPSTTPGIQGTYRLAVPGSNVVSQATRTDRELSITSSTGETTLYARAKQFDTRDGSYLGFLSQQARQVIRWPKDDRGNMQLAPWVPGIPPRFRASKMQIDSVQAVQLPDPGKTLQVRLAPETVGNTDWLGVYGRSFFEFRKPTDADDCVWTMVHVSGDVYRVQCLTGGVGRELVTEKRGTRSIPALGDISKDPSHLWRIEPDRSAPGAFHVRSFRNGAYLGFEGSGGLGLFDAPLRNFGTSWRIDRQANARPVSRIVSRDVRTGKASPDVRAELVNSGSKELWVLLVRNQDTRRPQRLRIPANDSISVTLKIDPPITIVETYEFISGAGYQREDIVTELPSPTHFDLSVYEVIAQSVSIDRTVPGGKVEGVNYAPSSVGWFALPTVGNGERIDVVHEARAMRNPGAVRRLDMEFWQPRKKRDPIQDAIDRVKK